MAAEGGIYVHLHPLSSLRIELMQRVSVNSKINNKTAIKKGKK
jgi:hypothetical protein